MRSIPNHICVFAEYDDEWLVCMADAFDNMLLGWGRACRRFKRKDER